MKQILTQFVQDRRKSQAVFWGLTALMLVRGILFRDQDWLLYLLVGATFVWAVIYNAVHKQETHQQLQQRHRNYVWVVLALVVAVLLIVLDPFGWDPTVRTLDQYVPKAQP